MGDVYSIALVFLQEILLKVSHITQRHLQENGIRAITILFIHRYVLVPIFILLMYLIDLDFIEKVSSDFLWVYPLITLIVWPLAMWMKIASQDIASSLTYTKAVTKALHIPTLMIFGFIINHDIPGTMDYMAFLFFLLAIFITPTQHKSNARDLLKYKLALAVFLTVAPMIMFAYNTNLMREFLLITEAPLLGGILYAIASKLGVLIFFVFYKSIRNESKSISAVPKELNLFMILLVIIHTVTALTQAYAHYTMTAYQVVSIGSIVLLFDFYSDWKKKRLLFNAKTIVHMGLIIAGTISGVLASSN